MSYHDGLGEDAVAGLVWRWLGECAALAGLERWGWDERERWEMLALRLGAVGVYVEGWKL